jgi:hypothetical protein
MKSLQSSPLQPKTLCLALVAIVLCLSSQSFAACPEPASGTVAICQPSPNSTVYQVPHIEVNSSPTSGSITNMNVYLDNQLFFQNAGPSLDLFPGGVANGTHHLVINTWDDFGRLYQAQETFTVTGNLPFSCPPTAVGVRICAPAQGDVISQNVGFSVGFKGNAPISHVRTYIDGTDVFDLTPSSGQNSVVAGGSNTTPGSHTLTVVAWDATGAVYSSSVAIKTYYDGNCPPKGNVCPPGIYPETPNDGDDVTSPFRLSASVQNNTASITALKVYVDGALAASATGPTFDQPITAAKGTHIVIVQAWDTAGKLYRLTENVNVQ